VALRICSFQGLQNLPLVAAQRRGELAALGLDVTLEMTNSSARQLAALAAGVYDLIHTAPDNVINYNSSPAAFGLDPANAPRAVMLMGGSNGPLTMYTRPDVPNVAALRNQQVGVDNPSSGFALVQRDLLALLGLDLNRDYAFVVAGGTGTRLRGLLTGAYAATILYPPFDAEAEAAGCHPLASSVTAYSAYASQALAGLQAWAAERPELLTRYITALLRALRWIYNPATRAEVETLIASEAAALGVAPSAAAQALVAFTAPIHRLRPGGAAHPQRSSPGHCPPRPIWRARCAAWRASRLLRSDRLPPRADHAVRTAHRTT
jgi:ABC-type nitrate/sulfonate/bicarbonate transport system substrate-binding protein